MKGELRMKCLIRYAVITIGVQCLEDTSWSDLEKGIAQFSECFYGLKSLATDGMRSLVVCDCYVSIGNKDFLFWQHT